MIEGSDSEVLEQLKKIIEKKKTANGTKAQLKPVFNDEGVCEKVGVVVKWGGEVSCHFLVVAGDVRFIKVL